MFFCHFLSIYTENTLSISNILNIYGSEMVHDNTCPELKWANYWRRFQLSNMKDSILSTIFEDSVHFSSPNDEFWSSVISHPARWSFSFILGIMNKLSVLGGQSLFRKIACSAFVKEYIIEYYVLGGSPYSNSVNNKDCQAHRGPCQNISWYDFTYEFSDIQ